MDRGKSTEKQLVFRITAFHSSVWWFVVSSAEDFHVQVYAAPPVPPLLPHIPSESLSFFLIAIFIIINQLPAGHEAGSLAIFLRPTSSGSFPSSHTPSSTSLTFPPHLPHGLSCSLSPSLTPPPSSPQLLVNWFALCVMQMFGWVSVASSVESVQPCVYMDSALLTINHCFVLLLLKVSVLHRETVGNLKNICNFDSEEFPEYGGNPTMCNSCHGLWTDHRPARLLPPHLWSHILPAFSYPCRLFPKSGSHQYARVPFGRSEVSDHTLISPQDLQRDLWPQAAAVIAGQIKRF